MLIALPTVLGLLLTVVLLLALAGMAWRLEAGPGVQVFGILQALSALWAGCTIVGLWLPPGDLRLRVWGITNGLSLVVIVFWLGFILSYTGRDDWLERRRFVAVSSPLLAGAALYAVAPAWGPLTGTTTQATITAGTVVRASIGPIGGLLGIYVYLIFVAGLALVATTILVGNSLFIGQGVAFALGTLVSVVGSVLTIAGIPIEGYPTTQVSLGLQTLFWGYAVFGQQFLQTVPAVATIGVQTVFEDIEEGVLVVDSSGTVTRANERARAYLDAENVVGKPVTPVHERIGVDGFSDLPARFETPGRTYLANPSEITDWRDETIGNAIVIQDVTPLLRRQQRLQVLNRVLRHNVRNDMTVVLGVGGHLGKSDDEELANMGNRLSETATDLATISEKAIEVDRLLDEPVSVKRVDVEEVVDRVTSPLLDEYATATVRRDLAVETVYTDSRVLSLVLRELVENALEHTGGDPEVSVAVTRTDQTIHISVTDNGSGIPNREIEPITSGGETDLQHASSLGLWLVHWGARALGGTVDFSASNTGSTVTVSLPDMEHTEGAAPDQTVRGARSIDRSRQQPGESDRTPD